MSESTGEGIAKGMRAVAVYEGDSIRYVVDLSPEIWSAAQRLVTEEEFYILEEMVRRQKEMQEKLKEIQEREEYEPLGREGE